MKKVAFLFIILLILPVISAVEFDIKGEFSQGETLMAKVSGNFLLPLQKTNVVFYRKHVRIPVEYGIKKIGEDYYIYASLVGKEPNNYSIALENIKYMKGGEVSEKDIIRNFTINNQTADFSINPGFASENTFSIEVQNLQDKKLTIEIRVDGEIYREPIILKSGQKEDIDFLFEVSEVTIKTIELNTENLHYEIPAFIPPSEISKEFFKFEPQTLIISAPTNSEERETVYLYNTGDEELTDITISLSDSLQSYVNISKESVNKIKANSNIPIELIFSSEEEFELEGYIRADIKGKTIYSQVSIKFLENYVPAGESPKEYTTKTCAEMKYSICSGDETCKGGDVIYAKDDVCCVGTCIKKESNSKGKIIGILILIIIIVTGIWFYKKKYKKAKKPVDLLKIARGKKLMSSVSPKVNKNRRSFNKKKITEKPLVKVVEKPVVKEVIKKVFVERPKTPLWRYTGSSNTKRYHRGNCRLAKLIKEEYRESNNDPTYFQKKGYRPCKVCLKP